jgi:hypothetical protein
VRAVRGLAEQDDPRIADRLDDRVDVVRVGAVRGCEGTAELADEVQRGHTGHRRNPHATLHEARPYPVPGNNILDAPGTGYAPWWWGFSMNLYDRIPLAGARVQPPALRGRAVEFVLRYKGPLTSGEHAAKDKLRVRDYLHPQLEQLCVVGGFFQDAGRPDLTLNTVVGGSKLGKTHFACEFSRVPMGGMEFVPLINRSWGLVCQIDITWLRREAPGRIIESGDIDGRLKILLDGMRMPHRESEMYGRKPREEGERCYCLLEDDVLISKLSVATAQLLAPLESGDKKNDFELIVGVTVQSASEDTARMFGISRAR